METYRLLHIFGALMVFGALGGHTVFAANGGNRKENALRVYTAIAHGVGLLLLLVAGFGMLARLQAGFPGWAILKLIVWLALGALATLPYKKPSWSGPIFILFPLLGAAAVALCIYKP